MWNGEKFKFEIYNLKASYINAIYLLLDTQTVPTYILLTSFSFFSFPFRHRHHRRRLSMRLRAYLFWSRRLLWNRWTSRCLGTHPASCSDTKRAAQWTLGWSTAWCATTWDDRRSTLSRKMYAASLLSSREKCAPGLKEGTRPWVVHRAPQWRSSTLGGEWNSPGKGSRGPCRRTFWTPSYCQSQAHLCSRWWSLSFCRLGTLPST